jgi:hypothetical protein
VEKSLPDALLIGGAVLLLALLIVWAYVAVLRMRRRRVWRSKRPIHVNVATYKPEDRPE